MSKRGEELTKQLEDMFAGFLCSADAEQFVMDGLQKYVDAFHQGDRSDHTMRRLRVYNDARRNRDYSRKQADAIAYAIQFCPPQPNPIKQENE